MSVLTLLASACVAVEAAPDEQGPAPLTKDDVRNMGKADGLDYCAIYNWYGDGICDEFCAQPDPDCLRWEGERFRPDGGQVKQAALALSDSGVPHVAYHTRYGVGLAQRLADGWEDEWINSAGLDGIVSDIAAAEGPSGGICLAYIRQESRALLLHCEWDGWQGRQLADDAWDSLSLTVGPAGRPHLAYQSIEGGGDHHLRYVTLAQQPETIATSWSFTGTSLAVDGDGRIHVAYRVGEALGSSGVTARTGYAVRDGGGWTSETVEAIGDNWDRGPTAILVTGNGPEIAYHHNVRDEIRYAVRTETGWDIRTLKDHVDDDVAIALQMDESGRRHLAFSQRWAPLVDGGDKYPLYYGTSAAGAGWTIQRVVLPGDWKLDLSYFDDGDFDMTLDAFGVPHIVVRELNGHGFFHIHPEQSGGE